MTEGWQALILLEPRLGEAEKKAIYVEWQKRARQHIAEMKMPISGGRLAG